MASLWLLDENGLKSRGWDIGDQPLAIGRDETADVIVDDETLSRRHFMVVPGGQAFEVHDLDSQNGTFVDGKPADKTAIRHHNCIQAGRSLFIFDDPTTAGLQAALPRMRVS